MSELALRNPTKVRVEIVVEGVTYEVELSGGEASFGIDHHSAVVPSDEPWIVREPTGWATIKLTAFGQIVKAERRQRPPAKERRPRGGRPPMPGMDAACTRCRLPRRDHGGPKRMGACPGESGIQAKRFSVAEMGA
jgi:hypothetical protein